MEKEEGKPPAAQVPEVAEKTLEPLKKKAIDLSISSMSKTAKEKNKLFSPDQMKLMALVMKMVLNSQQVGREVCSVLFDVFLSLEAHSVVQEAKR